jgi:hypothetical protein
MGCGDFFVELIERLAEVCNLAGQNLGGVPGGVWKRRLLFGQLDKLVDAPNPFGGIMPNSER